MTTLSQTLCRKCRKSLLAGVALGALLVPVRAQSAERDGAVLFFSLEDLKEVLSQPSPSSLFQWPPSFTWRQQPEADEQEGPRAQNFRWGGGLGVDGYTRPGTRPLWGY